MRGNPDQRPDSSKADVEAFVFCMQAEDDWRTAKELCALFSLDDRSIRDLAAKSRGRVISGQQGYCATTKATPAEVHRASAWLRSQAREMLERADLIDARILKAAQDDAPWWTDAPETI